MAVAGILKVLVSADTKKFEDGIDRMGKRLNAMGPTVAAYGKVMAAAFATGVTASVVKAAQFEKQMSKVGSLLGDMEKQVLPGFTKGVQKLALETGQSVDSLSTALFDLVSAGMDVDQSMNILSESAKLAVGGFTTTDAATQALITTMQTFKGEIKDAADASDFLFAVQKGGRLTVEQVATTIGSFAAVGKAAGVSAKDLGAAFAAISLSGEGAELAGTQLRAILISLQKDAEGMAKRARDMGKEIDFSKLQTEGLIPWLRQFKDLTGEQRAKIFAESRALRGMNTMLANLEETQKRVNIVTNRAGSASEAYARRQEELALQFAKGIALIKEMAQEIGEQLMPVVKELIAFVLENKEPILSFAKSLGKTLKEYISDLRLIVKGVKENKKTFLSFLRTVAPGATIVLDVLHATGKIGRGPAPTIPGPGPFMGPMPLPKGAGEPGAVGGGEDFTGDDGGYGALLTGAVDFPGPFNAETVLDTTRETTAEFWQLWDDSFKMVFDSSEATFQAITEVMTGVTNVLSTGFQGMFVEMAEGTGRIGEVLGEMAKGFRNLMFKIIADILAKQLAAWAIGMARKALDTVRELGFAAAVGKAWALASQMKFGFWGLITAGALIAAFVAMMSGFTAFAEGGIVTKPTMGLVGEAGPEAIIPLSKAGALGGTTNINITIAGDFVEADEAKWDDLVRSKIVPALQANNAKGLGGLV